MNDIYFSVERKKELQAELDHLTSVTRGEIASEIETAKSHGDLSENAEYHAARERQGKIEGRIRELEYMLNHGQIAQGGTDIASVGSVVEVFNKKSKTKQTYTIVGLEEQDIMNGKISNTSPIATAILGKKIGETALFNTPKGVTELEIISIS